MSRMRLLLATALFLFLSLILAGCDGDDDVQEIYIDPFQAQVGSSWTYEINRDSETHRIRPLIQVAEVEYADGIKVYHYDTSGEYVNYWDEEGLHESITPPDSTPDVDGGWANWFFKYPVEAGETWECFSDPGPYNTTCVSAGTSVTVPYGTVENCLLYRIDSRNSYEEYVWIKPDIGIIKRAFYSSDGENTTNMSLVSFSL